MSIKSVESRRHRVVVIGSGFGGLFGTQALKNADVDITMIARTTHHLFQPLLYQVATGILSVGDIAPATRLVLRKQKNTQVLLGDVEKIDLEAKTITSRFLDRTTVTPYDSLIVFASRSILSTSPSRTLVFFCLRSTNRVAGAMSPTERMPVAT